MPDGADAVLHREAVTRWEATRERAGADYEWLLGKDVARELARIDLPLSTYTQWYWKIDLHNLIHFLTLRADPHAQYEIRAFAEVMAGMLKRVAPLSYEAWVDYGLAAAPMSHAELEALRSLIGVTEADGEVKLTARSGAGLDSGALRDLGLSKRERIELAEKLRPSSRPDFELDLGTMRPGEEVGELMQSAVPKLDLD